ncbi:efflux RND transporter periplasmic adaptor subunit [Gluconacetobacter takamatsuzukensis]|uniref:Efflux RND transporter periplasmic adaptor subunit n=2 Tax=Gluconacetobacter takamatsuzukensis TaxID=1286190 RepID=A0A7W4PQ42_9PROT|nr:efflux RND transporter periplasmic adaptor subunit [Gluconacetobacter takamatsuzukensis]
MQPVVPAQPAGAAQPSAPLHSAVELQSPVGAAAVASASPLGTQSAAHRPAIQISTPVSAQISATMSGQLTEFPFRDGDRFRAGDVLARFQCGQQKATLAHARAEYVKRKGLLEVQNRMKALGQWSVSDLRSASADVDAAEADLEMGTAVVAQCTIVAPFNGRVSNVLVHNYQYLSPGTPMLDILDDSSLELSMIVSSMELQQLRPGTPYKVWIHETDHTYDAVVTRLSGKVDPVSKTIKVYGQLVRPEPDLLPGMTGDAILTN